MGLDELSYLRKKVETFPYKKQAKKEKHYFIVRGLQFEDFEKTMNQQQMIKYAKKMLAMNKLQGLDREITSKDLSVPINAWVYLRNIGLGLRTNKTKW